MSETPTPTSTRKPNSGRVRIGAVIAIVLAIGFVIWLLVRGDDSSGDAAKPPERAPASAATVADLEALQSELKHPVYWAGPKKGYTYELTRTADGSVYVRYLPPGIAAGAGGGAFLSIGTYPDDDAFGTVKDATKKPNEQVRKISGGGLAVSNPDVPGSVYMARPDDKFLIEVYDPSTARAFRLATSGRVVPIS